MLFYEGMLYNYSYVNKDPTIVLKIILINSVTFSDIVDCLERGLFTIS